MLSCIFIKKGTIAPFFAFTNYLDGTASIFF